MPMSSASAGRDAPLIASNLIAAGNGWRVRRVVCRAGPGAPRAEERHEWTGVAVVASGTFTYRADAGTAMLAPGALLLMNAGACFECGHEHGTGDTCISFQFAPALVESAFAGFSAQARCRFPASVVPPIHATLPLTSRAATTREAGEGDEEFAMRLLHVAIAATHGHARRRPRVASDEAVVAHLLRQIAETPQACWSLGVLCERSRLDRFRLLRAFRHVAGVTPYQYVLRQRLDAAACSLMRHAAPVHAVSLDCGFNDLSEFNRRFRRHFGVSPTQFRRLNRS